MRIDVLDTAWNSVLLPLLGMPTRAMRKRRSPRNSGVRSGMVTVLDTPFIKVLFPTRAPYDKQSPCATTAQRR